MVSKNEKKKGEKSVGKKYTNTKDHTTNKLTTTKKKKSSTRCLIGNQRIHPLCHTAARLRFDRTGVRTRDLFNFNNTFLDVWDRKKTVKVSTSGFFSSLKTTFSFYRKGGAFVKNYSRKEWFT